jgi:hypothetical protein
VISDLEIYRCANMLLRQHGEEAPARALERAEQLAGQGAGEGAAVWLRIKAAAEALRNITPPRREQLH